MTQEEIINGNKLIAEFMGLKIITDGISSFDASYTPLRNYHSSWDWLMPVVDKIENLGFDFCIMKEAIFIRRQYDYWEVNNSSNKIKATWEEAFKFIKWYNTKEL